MNIIMPINLPLCDKGIFALVWVKFAHALSKKCRVYVIYSGKVSNSEIEKYHNISINNNLCFLSTRRCKFFKPFKLSISQVSKWHIIKHIFKLTKQNTKQEWIIYNSERRLHNYLKRFSANNQLKYIYEIHDLSRLPNLHNIHLTITTTNALKDKLVSSTNHTGKVETRYLSPNIPNITACDYQTSGDSKTLIYTGKVHTDRGIYLLLDSLKYLDSDYQIAIFGGIEREIKAAKDYCKQQQINHKIIFHGHLSVVELAKEIARIKGIIVIPPLNIRGYNEVAHTKASDALVAGRVIVASDLSSIREIVPAENGFFHAGDALALANAIKKISTLPPATLNEIVKINQSKAQSLSYENCAQQLLSTLEF